MQLNAHRRAWIRRIRSRVAQAVRDFALCRHGGAMLYSGAVAIGLLTTMGATMTNYAWHEAQNAELRSAMRAAISTTAQLLPRVTESAVEEMIRERTAAVLAGLVEGLGIDKDDITIAYDAATRIIRITIGGQATIRYDTLWGADTNAGQGAALPNETVAVTVDIDRYEIAVAADVTRSMASQFGTPAVVKMTALQDAIDAAIDIVESRNLETTSSMTMALVPFGHVVNVADTSGAGETADKRRYAHMLGGAAVGTAGVDGTTGHWVDTFHHYGAGGAMGPLLEQTLPIFETPANWDLRQTMAPDVSTQAPAVGTWNVNGDDFWNGCVMARWGAYWNVDARPAAWDPNDASNWPASGDVNGWTPASTALTGEPFHLSDAPPAMADPNTRFTAYSYPDSRIGGPADARLEAILYETLHPNDVDGTLINQLANYRGDNNWAHRGRASGGDGSAYCPANAVLPLTDAVATLRASATALETLGQLRVGMNTRSGGTYLHLGVVWGLRTLSPLWRDVWSATDAAGAARPLTPCATGETGTHCQSDVEKVILLVTDGSNDFPPRGGGWGPVNEARPNENPGQPAQAYCAMLENIDGAASYNDIFDTQDSTVFDAEFDLDGAGTFTGAKLTPLINAITRIVDPAASNADKMNWATALSGETPWQLFRGDGGFADNLPGASLNLGGRPVFNGYACRLTSAFGPYGRVDDSVQVGGDPVADVAPWQAAGDWTATRTQAIGTLDDWLDDACALAGDRGVRIRAIYIGNSTGATNIGNINRLRQCAIAAGGANGDVLVAPDATSLENAFERIFTVRRNVRFLN